MTISQIFILWIGGALTLMIFSFLYKDNPSYKFAEHLFVGVSAAYWMVTGFWTTLMPNMLGFLYPPSVGWFAVDPAKAEGVISSLYEASWGWRMGRIVPLIFGIMLLMRLTKKASWLSRWPMAFIIGYAAGTNLPRYLQSDFVAQIKATLIPIIVFDNSGFSLGGTISNILIVFGVLSALVYFFFSVEHKGVAGKISRVGIWFLMITFGAAFGYTVMARVSLVIGRFQFLMGEWLELPIGK